MQQTVYFQRQTHIYSVVEMYADRKAKIRPYAVRRLTNKEIRSRQYVGRDDLPSLVLYFRYYVG